MYWQYVHTKLFILITMMYSGIKWMVLFIAYHFRMRVNALESRSHEKNPTTYAAKNRSTPHRNCVCAVSKVWLVDSIVNLETFDHIVWCLELYPVLCVL